MFAGLLCGADPNQAGYVGSRVCSGCHARLYKDYVGTAMGRSVIAASETRGLVPASGSAAVQSGDFRYQVARRGDELYQDEVQIDAFGGVVFQRSFKLEYGMGSGANGITYAIRKGSYLFEAPLSYYQRVRAWRLSPGYETSNAGFSRPIAAGCVACHSGRARAVADRDGLYGDPPFSEMAIGCENCHGPGAAHARRPAKSNIVNPAKLSPSRAEEICMTCHQAGDARVYQTGKSGTDFRPGTPLSDVVAIFKVPLDRATAAPADLLEHHFAMKLSKCFTGSGGRLSCLTCHDPHEMPSKTDAAAYFEKKCATCHTVNSCKLPPDQRARSAEGCIGCHMPKRDIGFISHSALTNHRIVARRDEPLPAAAYHQTAPDLADLIFLNRSSSEPVSPLVQWQAYGELAERWPKYEARYLELLDVVAAQSPGNALVQAALGRKALRQGGPASAQLAVEHLTKSLQLGFSAPTAFEDLADALAALGKSDEAIETLKRGIELSPYAARLHKNLILQYIQSKRYALAKAEMRQYLELFPEDTLVRDLLRKAGG